MHKPETTTTSSVDHLPTDRLLGGVAEAARRLLAITDFEIAVNLALEAIATAAGIDRIYVMENPIIPSTGADVTNCLYEWTLPGMHQISPPPTDFLISDGGFDNGVQVLRSGRSVQAIIREPSTQAQTIQAQNTARSRLTVPIMLNGAWWGVMGFDNCIRARIWSETEISILETAAASLAGALQRRDNQVELERRDALLKCVNAATQCLVANDNLAVALLATLKILGEGTQQSRAYILRNSQATPTDELMFNLHLEWDAPHIPSKTATGGHFPVPVSAFPAHLSDPLKTGRATQFLARELDGICPNQRPPGQARSLMGVPITINGQWWGLLGLDNCIEERVWSEAEITVLKTAATAVGNAIERDQSRQDRAVAERTALIERERAARADELEATNQILLTRDRWLETTAAAANELIATTDVDASVNAALATLGENLECDFVFVRQYITNPDIPGDLGIGRLIYEWDAAGIPRHMDNPQIRDLPVASFPAAYQQLITSQWFGGIVDELDEPLRSHHLALGLKSFFAVPVLIKGKAWGIVGMGHCRVAKLLNAAELAVFRTAATCIGSAIDQAEVRRDQAAQEQAKLLSRVAEAANLLLRSTDYTSVFPQVVRLLGEAVECDRCGIGQDVPHPISGEPAVNVPPEWEWRSTTTAPAASFSPHGDQLYSWKDGPFLTEQMRLGVVASHLVADLPEADRQLMARQGTTATLFVPITVGQQMWGFIHFDSNQPQPRLYGEAEIAILKVAAESIAAAIARQAQDVALRQSEQAVLDERNRLAREIHDTLAQAFTGVSLQLEVVRGLTNNPNHPDTAASLKQAQAFIRRARDLARQGLSEARRSVHALRSAALETDDLPNALQKVLRQTQRDTGLTTQFHLEGVPLPLSDDCQLNLLRIAQEAITNTLRHAQATQLDITLGFTPPQIRLQIFDNGCGFHPQSLSEVTGFGLIGMRERAARLNGKFQIHSNPQQGTRITVQLPLSDIPNPHV
ncbi:GAF domain-containing protein [filamentous cyanobacterium LEGE 11480]|uniref:GAF domain-containing protein n=1 Tax=Romeriopsis navalis LEGE 11480 TaxID=2777977 RepID=A0A928Z305_9CYAN|nr:GAF domain-containing protein [Romeriopsis navalis]MBE9030124.1 GAF domain-containing protein [Romeriopsis navalis LEGE 11480]